VEEPENRSMEGLEDKLGNELEEERGGKSGEESEEEPIYLLLASMYGSDQPQEEKRHERSVALRLKRVHGNIVYKWVDFKCHDCSHKVRYKRVSEDTASFRSMVLQRAIIQLV
jgi:hypothetical protein